MLGQMRSADFRHQGGSVLLEALIAILIFSMGILAIVGLQAVSLKAVSESKYRVDASFLANEIVSIMWVDRSNLAAYAWDGAGTAPAALASWVTQVQSALPGATTNPPIITIAGNVVTVTVFWQPPREPSVHQYVALTDISG